MLKHRWVIAAVTLGALAFPAAAAAHGRGAVFTLSNSASGNRVLVFARHAGGTLSPAGSVATGGVGTAANGNEQGAVALSADGRRLYAVNEGSNTVTVFRVHGTHLRRVGAIGSGGAGPLSVTVGHGRVYVLNAGTPNVVGFRVTGGGLARIEGGTTPLAGGDTGPAQVSLNPAGTALAVTNTGSSTIDTITLDRWGAVRGLRSFPSAGATPFGFAFTRRGLLVVSDAHEAPTSAATSYRIRHSGALALLSGPVQANQLAACWVAVTPDGRFAFTANAGSGTISTYRVGHGGHLSLVDPSGISGNTGATSKPLDEAVTPDGRYLDVYTAGLHSITTFRIGDDGSLTLVSSAGALPDGTIGLAAS